MKFSLRSFERDELRWTRARAAILMALVLFGASLVVLRAYKLQVEQTQDLSAMVEDQSIRTVALAPKRGTIRDRNGAVLAVSVEADSVFANPRRMREEGVDIERAAAALAKILGTNPASTYRRLSRDKLFVWLKRHVTPAQAARVQALKIPGVRLQREPKRYYPNGALASHVLGFVNVDGEGIAGLELSQNESLKGLERTVRALRDSRGRVVFADTFFEEHSVLGADIELSIDRMIQHIAEKELSLAAHTFEAKAASVIVMDPHSGDILAMANYPTFDPNKAGAFDVASRRNRAVTDPYEPGSTLKQFTIAGALARGAIRPDERIDCQEGAMDIGDDTIHDTSKHGLLTPAKILAKSSNIGAAKIGAQLGKKNLFRTLRAFGFGRTFDIELPGETRGILRHYSDWYELDAATIAFGQGISVSTLQLAVATAALANGGKLMQPRIVRRHVDANGTVQQTFHTKMVRRPIPRHVAKTVSEMMIGVTGDEGTGSEAALEGYLVAGKTGTAEKADHRRGGYSEDRWVASFTGFVPATSPRLVITVAIDEPIIAHSGGTVAGPVFRRIAERSLRYLGVAPRAIGSKSFSRATKDDEPVEASFEPSDPVAAGQVRVPDFRKLHARAAFTKGVESRLAVELKGSGTVAWQVPEPGAVLPEGAVVTLGLERTWTRAEPLEEPDPTQVAAVHQQPAQEGVH